MLVAKAFALDKTVSSYGSKRRIGWPETRIPLDPATGRGESSRRSNQSNPYGSYCHAVAKGLTTWAGTVTGDKLAFDMNESMQTNTCCPAKARRASCRLTMPAP